MSKFAAYDDAAIYAVANYPDKAVAIAREDAREPEASFKTAPISDELYEQIIAHGWNGVSQSFEIDRATGYIVETTNQ